MTVAELIGKLREQPQDATVRGWDVRLDEPMPEVVVHYEACDHEVCLISDWPVGVQFQRRSPFGDK